MRFQTKVYSIYSTYQDRIVRQTYYETLTEHDCRPFSTSIKSQRAADDVSSPEFGLTRCANRIVRLQGSETRIKVELKKIEIRYVLGVPKSK